MIIFSFLKYVVKFNSKDIQPGVFYFFKYISLIMLLLLSQFPPFVPLHPVSPFPSSNPHLQFMSMGHIYKFFGSSISYTVPNIPMSILYSPICTLILNDSLAWQSSLDCRSLFIITWNTSFQSLLACKVSFEKSANSPMGTPLQVTICFFLLLLRFSLCL